MLIEQAVDLAASSQRVVQGLMDISGKDLAAIITAATTSGEALLENSGLLRLDEASHCNFGAQLGRPLSRESSTALPLRWWNDKARSLTPGFIGEVRVRPHSDELAELAIVGQYYPRAHLHELVDPAFLGRMATAVVESFLDRLRKRLADLTASRPIVQPIAS